MSNAPYGYRYITVRDGEGQARFEAVPVSELSEFHVESAIAAVHATAPRTVDTDWAKIVSLYDTLMTIRPSPVVALNRAIAIAERALCRLLILTTRSTRQKSCLSTYLGQVALSPR